MAEPDTIRLQRPQTAAEEAAYRDFRWRQLRRPWGQPPDPADAPDEQRGDHLVAVDAAGKVVGCGRLVPRPGGIGQIRAMAVAPAHRDQGLGARILARLEDYARGRGLTRLEVHAREPAVGLYRRHGYRDWKDGGVLFDAIPHLWLEKALDPADFSAFGLTRRRAADVDAEAVGRLVFEVLGRYGLAPERDGIDRDLEALDASYRGGFFDLLEDAGGALVGTVAVRRLDNRCGELRRMYLRPDWRSRGLGRACLGHALAWSRGQGLERLELETASVLREALALYRWAGFTPMVGENEARRCDQRLQLEGF